MILDTLDAIGKYAGISPNFETAVRWLQETDPETMKLGMTEIDGEKVYAVVSENRLEPREPVFEVHRRYADIQIILQGREGFRYGREGKELSGKPENDVWFCVKRTGRYPLSWKKADSRFSCRERRMPPGFIRRKTGGLCLLRRPCRTGSSL